LCHGANCQSSFRSHLLHVAVLKIYWMPFAFAPSFLYAFADFHPVLLVLLSMGRFRPLPRWRRASGCSQPLPSSSSSSCCKASSKRPPPRSLYSNAAADAATAAASAFVTFLVVKPLYTRRAADLKIQGDCFITQCISISLLCIGKRISIIIFALRLAQ
jgi:hypothetical protein